MGQASFRLPDEVVAEVEDRLVQGQPKSTWFRYSAETMVLVEQVLDGTHDTHDYSGRKQFVVDAVREKKRRDEVEDDLDDQVEQQVEA